MRSLVTGANGHVGANLVRALLDAGDDVVAFTRNGADIRGLDGLNVTHAHGDILDKSSLEAAMRGCARVFHAAAVYRNSAPNADDILRPAIEGTQNVMSAARAAAVKLVVHTSSNACIGYGKGPPLDETSTMTDAKSPYIKAKCEAEKIALAAHGDGLTVVVVNPVGIIGPHDWRLTPTMRSFRGMMNGDPAVIDVCLTDVRDVATGHVLAGDKGRGGERYLLAGHNLTRSDVARELGAVLGKKIASPKLPKLVFSLVAWNEERKAKKTGADPALTRLILDDVAGGHLLYDGTKARRELGFSPRPLHETLRDTAAWIARLPS